MEHEAMKGLISKSNPRCNHLENYDVGFDNEICGWIETHLENDECDSQNECNVVIDKSLNEKKS